MLFRTVNFRIQTLALAALFCAFSAPTAWSKNQTGKLAPPLESVSGAQSGSSSDLSVVDSIHIAGDPTLSEASVFEVLDIAAGKPISRAALNEALTRAEQRLRLSGNYSTVELSLNKGSQRNHYKIEVKVALLSSTYFGVTLKTHEKKEEEYDDWDDFDDKTEKTFLGGYVGSRDLFGLGLRADLEVVGGKTNTEKGKGEDHGDDFSAVLSLLKPASAEGAVFYGANITFSYTNENSETKYGQEDRWNTGSRSHYTNELYLLQPILGIRRGFTTFTLAPARYFSWSRDYSTYSSSDWNSETDEVVWTQESSTNHSRTYATILSLNLRYSEKTYLAALEPGLEASLAHTQFLVNDFSFRTLNASLANTWIFASSHGIRPTAIVQYEWVSFDTISKLEKKYDVGLRYDFASRWNWVFGVDRSIYGEINTPKDQRYERLPTWRNGLFARYVTATFGAEIALIYGHEGLSDQHFVFSTAANRRTQP